MNNGENSDVFYLLETADLIMVGIIDYGIMQNLIQQRQTQTQSVEHNPIGIQPAVAQTTKQ